MRPAPSFFRGLQLALLLSALGWMVVGALAWAVLP